MASTKRSKALNKGGKFPAPTHPIGTVGLELAELAHLLSTPHTHRPCTRKR
jgi:hypothetical protein